MLAVRRAETLGGSIGKILTLTNAKLLRNFANGDRNTLDNDGVLPMREHIQDDSQRDKYEELTKLYGVGPETARILLFEVCHQYNTFDHIAPWQQKIYSQLFYKKSLVPTNKIRDDIKKQYGDYSMLAVHYIWEDIFWKRKNEKIDWLEKEIRL